MGGNKWTADRDAKLLLLLLPYMSGSGKYEQLAAKWKESYPNETFLPTARALENRLVSLKKQSGAGPKASATPQTPKTPKTPTMPQTPASSAKRAGAKIATTPSKRSRSSAKAKRKDESDEAELDDNDDESDAEMAQPSAGPPRKTLSRRSKKIGVTYAEVPDDTDDDDEDEDDDDDDDDREGQEQGQELDGAIHDAMPKLMLAAAEVKKPEGLTEDPSEGIRDTSNQVDEGVAADDRESDSDISAYDPRA